MSQISWPLTFPKTSPASINVTSCCGSNSQYGWLNYSIETKNTDFLSISYVFLYVFSKHFLTNGLKILLLLWISFCQMGLFLKFDHKTISTAFKETSQSYKKKKWTSEGQKLKSNLLEPHLLPQIWGFPWASNLWFYKHFLYCLLTHKSPH